MESEFLTRLLTPSKIMHWLLLLFPLVVAVSGVTGIRRHLRGAVRLFVLALLCFLWLVLPFTFADPALHMISVMLSVILWFSVLAAWVAFVSDGLPNPVWAHGWVVSHLVTILIACVVALWRALAG